MSTEVTAEIIADAIYGNVNDFYDKRIDYDRFSTLNRALYDCAIARGIHMAVTAELLRREKAGKRAA
jgi:lipoprotein signal peptidase